MLVALPGLANNSRSREETSQRYEAAPKHLVGRLMGTVKVERLMMMIRPEEDGDGNNGVEDCELVLACQANLPCLLNLFCDAEEI